MVQDECLMEPILMTSVLSKCTFRYSTKALTSSVKESIELKVIQTPIHE